jgi:hypothetical protein
VSRIIFTPFKNEDQERDFWVKVDLGDYFAPKDFTHVDFSNLKVTQTMENKTAN